ncbi:MAG TPA: hypothetical protein VE990_09160 [Acidimicrobiales bacterium]|nr:hypothetical protein [Acidimicrobiales bacterium]
MEGRQGTGGSGGYASGGRPLAEVVESVEQAGYPGQVVVEAGDRLVCRQCGQSAPSATYEVGRAEREEGPSDPADMALVVGVRCPGCGAGSTLVLKYGPLASPEEAEVARSIAIQRS